MTSRFDYADNVLVDTATGLPPTQADIDACDKAHTALMLADAAFQLALVAKYGCRAGDMRYRRAADAWRATWTKPEVSA